MKPLAYLSDILHRTDVSFDIRRTEERSGAGSGDFWSAELAPPLWQASVALADVDAAQGARVNALVRRLGTDGTLLVADTHVAAIDVPGPVTVNTIGGERDSLSLSGLPAGQTLQVGQRLSVAFGGGGIYYAEIGSDVTADGSGDTPLIDLYPYLPAGIEVGQAVDVATPACKVKIETFKPYVLTVDGNARGAALSLLEAP